MNLLDFLKKNNEEKHFIGRHQEVLLIKEVLGESIPKMIMQLAINKDIAEREEIKCRLEIIESNIKSNNFTTVFDIEMTNKEIMDLIFDGYKSCVLQNDLELEIRCFNIYEDTVEYAKYHHEKKGSLNEEMNTGIDDIKGRMILTGCLHWVTLSDTLSTSQEQHAWMIISSLLYQNKPVYSFNKGNLVADVVGWPSSPNQPKDKRDELLKQTAERFKEMNKRLLENKIITNDEGNIVDNLIKIGLKI